MFSSSASPFGTSTAGQGLFGVAQQQPAATTNLFGTQQQQPASTGGGLFGSTTQTNSAGSTLGTGGLFGQQQQTGGGLFGSTAGGGGGGLFGTPQQPQQQTAGGGFFGSSSTTNTAPAGTPASGGLFGSSTVFGQPQQQQTTGLFGGSTGFGQQQQQPLAGTGGGGLFGGASTTGFGQPQQQQQTSGLFGSSAPASTTGGGLFGSSTGVFGQPQQQQQQGGLFGGSTGTGGTTTGLFGQPQQQATGLFGGSATSQPATTGGLFGVSSSANALGTASSSPFGVQQQQEPFKPFAVEDGSVMTICHGPFEKVCLEEIRWNYYQQHGRGVGAQGPVAGALTATSLPTTVAGGGGLFGAPATGAQGTTGSGFGGLFGSNNALQQQPAAAGGGGLFGSSNTLQQQQPSTATGGGLFGSTAATTGASNVFGGGGGSLFGGAAAQPQQQQGGLFGSSATATPAAGGGLFGSSTGGLFGKPSTGTGFGTTTNTLGTTNQGGGGLFGASSLGTSGGGGLFGSTANTANATGTGGLFGQQQQPQQQQQTGGGGLFGGFGSGTSGATTTQPSTGGGLFGGSNTQQQQGGGLLGGTSSLFGAKPATGGGVTTTGLFGSSTNALGSGGGGLFGSAPAGGTPSAGAGGLLGASSSGGGGLFGSAAATGNTSANTAGGGGLFGNLGRSTGGSVLGGGLFGSAGAPKTGGGLFGTGGTLSLQQPQQQQQQQGGLFGLGGSGADQQQRQQLVGAAGGPSSSGGNLLALGGLLGAPQVTVHIVLSAANTPPSQLACAPVSSVEDGCCLGGTAPPQLARRARRFLPALPGLGGEGLPLSLTQSGSGLGASFSLPPQFLQRQRQLMQQLPSISPDSSSRNGWLAQTLSKSLAAVQQQQRQALLPLSSLDYQLLQRMQGATTGGASLGALRKGEEASDVEQPSEGSDEQQLQQQQQQQQQQNTLSIAAAAAAAAVADAGLSSTSSSSSSSSSSAEAQQEAARAPLELRPVLTNPEYECVPSISSLQQMSEEELQRVRDFSIRRPGVGKILFPGHTDLRGINLDLVVHIDHLEVSVYADEAPPVGVGLNKKAQVTLCNCKPSKAVDEEAGGSSSSGDSGKTGAAEDEAAAAEQKQRFVDRVRQYTEKMGARFLSLDVQTWEWRFEVQHFSVYRWIDEEAAATTQQSDAAQAAQVAAFAAAAPAAAAPKEFALQAQRAQILRTAPQAILAAVAQKQQQQQQQQQRAADAEAAGQSSEQQQAAVEQRQQHPQQQEQQQQQAVAAAADPKQSTYSEEPVKTGNASEDAPAAPAAPAHVAAAPAAAAPRSWLKHPPFPVRCAPTLGPRGLCALPVFRAPALEAAAAAGSDSRSQGAYEVALLQLSPLLPPAAAPHGFVWPQPFAREAAATISAAHAAAAAAAGSSSGCSGSQVAASRAGWTAGEVPMPHAVQQDTPANPLRAEEAVEAAARDYISSSVNSSSSSSSSRWSGPMERGKAANLEEEGVRVVWDLKESIRLHLFDSGLSVHRGLAAAAAAAAVGEVFEAFKDSEEGAATQADELHFRLKLMQQQSQPQQQLEPPTPSITQRLLLRMLRFLQQQSSCYAGSLEGGEPWPPASSWVPSAAAAAATPAAAAAAAASGILRRYSEASYLSPYMAQTWRLLAYLLLQPTELEQQQLQRLLQQGPNTELSVSLNAALERRRQLSILDWLLVEGRVMLLSFLRRACAAAALQQQQQQQWLQQQQQQLFLACNARALFEALRAKGELRRFVALLHILANGRGLACVHLLLRGGAFYPHLALTVAAHLQQPLGRQLLYADALQASTLPQPPQEVRRVYRLLGGAGPLAEEPNSSSKSRCVSTAAGLVFKETAAAARATAAPATASRDAASEDAAAAAAHAALWAEDLPFLDWRAELAAALLFSRETAALSSPPHLREELRPPPQAPDAPRDLKRALLFLEGFGRGRRCSCSACWGSAPLPLYVRQQQQASSLKQLFAASDQQQQQQQHQQQQQQQQQQHQQQQHHFKKLLSEEQFDLQFSLLRQHAGLVPPSLASVAAWRCSPYPLDSQLSWLAGMVLCMHFSNEAARQQDQHQQQQLPPLLWLPDTHWVARLPGASQASIRKLLQQQQHFSVSYAEQLEISGMWPIACGVLLLSPDRDAGVRAARCLVERYGRELSAEVSVHRRLWATEVLQQHLGIPRSWLQRAHAYLLQSRGRHLQAAFVYIDAYRHTEAPFEGFLGSAAGEKARAALQRQFPLQQEQQELLLAAAAALLKALPGFLQGLLFVLQHRQQQILLHGFCFTPGCNTALRQQHATTLHQQQRQQQQEFNSASEVEGGSAPLSPEEQMDLLQEAITLCCSQQLWPQQQEKLRCCSACIQWMQQEFKVSLCPSVNVSSSTISFGVAGVWGCELLVLLQLPSAVEGPTESNDADREQQQQQQVLQQQLACLLQQRSSCTEAERRCWASVQSALMEARGQHCV